MLRKSNLYFCALLITLFTGCITNEKGVTVMERSKKEAPAWSELATDKLSEAGAEWQLREVVDRQTDLTIGIGQVQSKALTTSLRLWSDKVWEEFTKRVGEKNLEALGSEQLTLKKTFLTEVEKVHGKQAGVKDIYFEKWQTEKPEELAPGMMLSEFYVIHVLVSIPKSAQDIFFKQLVQTLQPRGAKTISKWRGLDLEKLNAP